MADGWWTFDHRIAARSKLKNKSVPEFGILDHVFIGGGLEWHVLVRIIPNEDWLYGNLDFYQARWT